jgi:hypothetical protein
MYISRQKNIITKYALSAIPNVVESALTEDAIWLCGKMDCNVGMLASKISAREGGAIP